MLRQEKISSGNGNARKCTLKAFWQGNCKVAGEAFWRSWQLYQLLALVYNSAKCHLKLPIVNTMTMIRIKLSELPSKQKKMRLLTVTLTQTTTPTPTK